MNVAVDFDGTLTTDDGDPYWVDEYDEQPNETIVETVNELYNRGHTIIVYTARQEEYRSSVTMFLDKWDVKYHAVRMEKMGYDVLIDDRTVKPHDGQSADLVENFVDNH
jgi:uncharacterized HAD superfamily protein